MMTEMSWEVDEDVNRDKNGEADGMNLEVDSKDEVGCRAVTFGEEKTGRAPAHPSPSSLYQM